MTCLCSRDLCYILQEKLRRDVNKAFLLTRLCLVEKGVGLKSKAPCLWGWT